MVAEKVAWIVLVWFGAIAVVTLTGFWTANYHQARMECIERGGSHRGGACYYDRLTDPKRKSE